MTIAAMMRIVKKLKSIYSPFKNAVKKGPEMRFFVTI
jgi:hypothetical protein